MDGKWQQLKEWMDESSNIVFFGGAGVSTESGIPDFRSVDGLYNQQYKYPPETTASMSGIPRNSTVSIKTGCCLPRPGPMRRIRPWRIWRPLESLRL